MIIALQLHTRPCPGPLRTQPRSHASPGKRRRQARHGPIRKGVPPSCEDSPALFLTVTLALSVARRPARAGLFLSELCDPQTNYTTDRFIEIYNSGPDAVDLTGWSVVAIANDVDVCTWSLSGTHPGRPGQGHGLHDARDRLHRELPERGVERLHQLGRRLQLERQDR